MGVSRRVVDPAHLNQAPNPQLCGVSGVSPHLTMYLAKNPFVWNFYQMVDDPD